MELDEKREAVLAAVLAHLLEHGLEHAGVRALAASAGISDRMLIYYFGDKNALIRAALMRMTADLAAGLEAIVGDAAMDADALLALVDQALALPDFDRSTRLFFEVGARAGRGVEPYARAAREILDLWEAWIGARLACAPDGPSARDVLERIEGRLYLHVVRGAPATLAGNPP